MSRPPEDPDSYEMTHLLEDEDSLETNRLLEDENSRNPEASRVRGDIRKPKLYDFCDWQSFKNDTLRYHRLMFPEKSRIFDRVKTFQSFMSDGVVHYLRNEHPGVFEVGEFDSWNQWMNTVTKLLRARDTSISGWTDKSSNDPAESWRRRYKDGTISEKEFWIELNELVKKEVISVDKQVCLFWESHNWEQQRRLAELCPYFDPSDQAWDENAGYADRIIAQRLLNDAMHSNISNKVVLRRNILLVFGLILCGGIILTIVMFSLLAIPDVSLGDETKAFIAFVSVGSIASALAVTSIFVLFFTGLSWKRLRKVQSAYHLGISPSA